MTSVMSVWVWFLIITELLLKMEVTESLTEFILFSYWYLILVSVWHGHIRGQRIEASVVEGHLTSYSYLHFLQNKITCILEEVSYQARVNVALLYCIWVDKKHSTWTGTADVRLVVELTYLFTRACVSVHHSVPSVHWSLFVCSPELMSDHHRSAMFSPELVSLHHNSPVCLPELVSVHHSSSVCQPELMSLYHSSRLSSPELVCLPWPTCLSTRVDICLPQDTCLFTKACVCLPQLTFLFTTAHLSVRACLSVRHISPAVVHRSSFPYFFWEYTRVLVYQK
jgi:hypothetical protein